MKFANQPRRFCDVCSLTVQALSEGEQFVVGVWRCWDALTHDRDAELAPRLLGPVFEYMNMPGAWCAFGRACDALRRYQRRPFIMVEADHPFLTGDEARLLAGLAELQRLNTLAAAAVLKSLVVADGVPELMAPLARIAGCLAGAGHHLPAWTFCEARRVPSGSGSAVGEKQFQAVPQLS